MNRIKKNNSKTIQVIVFSRGRNEILEKSIQAWKRDELQYVIFHNSNVPISGLNAENIRYFHCPGLSYSSRAGMAKQWLTAKYAVILADDERFISHSVHKLVDILDQHEEKVSISGRVVGVHRYIRNYVTGSFAYKNMWNYSRNESDVVRRVENHLTHSINGGLPVGGLYRIMHKETMLQMLDTFAKLDFVSTPYIYEVIAEVLTAFSGPLINEDSIYWIRNWEVKMISHANWNRRTSFSKWWAEEEFRVEKSRVLVELSQSTGISIEELEYILDKYVVQRQYKEKSTDRISNRFREKIGILKRLFIFSFVKSKVPKSIRDVIVESERGIHEDEINLVLQATEEMLNL